MRVLRVGQLRTETRLLASFNQSQITIAMLCNARSNDSNQDGTPLSLTQQLKTLIPQVVDDPRPLPNSRSILVLLSHTIVASLLRLK